MNYLLPKIFQTNSFPFTRGYKTTKVIAKKDGYILHRFSNYVSLQNVKIVYNPNGFSKATIKVNTNYQTPYQYTIYFDNEGNEIKAENNSTKERKIWLEMQKNLLNK
jgi:hypothetical protein